MTFSNLQRILSVNLLVVALTMGPLTLHAQRNLKNIPIPDAELERKTFIVAEGFEVNLYAADPQIAKPIQMNFDAEGKLWIASSSVYPHIKPGEKANDKILVIEDRDGDGRADRTSVFADNLLIPTGVVPGDQGVYVVNSTELLHLQDVDGDGKADRRRVILSGFGSEDTHHLLHTLRWGHDGALYMNQSIYIHSHVETPYGVRRLGGGGIWRFRPDTMQLEIVCRGFVNPWGHHFDHWGQSFVTDGAYREGINYVFPGSVFVTAPGAKRFVAGLNPGSPKHCGLEIIGGGHLPESWQGNMITNDFRAHRVCRFVVSEDGAGYASRQETELIKSSHGAFRPIDVKMGPDGAIYIADWYNPIIQHGEVDFRDQRRDHVHGRIWRVSVKKRPLVKKTQLVGASTETLLASLSRPEEWIRLHAKLQLKARKPAEVRTALAQWLAGMDPEQPNYWHDRLEALWVYQCLNTMDTVYLGELVRAPDHRVRAAAMRVVSQWIEDFRLGTGVATRRADESSLRGYLQAGVVDSHPRVRLEATRGWARLKNRESAAEALKVLDQPMDRFLDFALWQTMRDLKEVWLPAVISGKISIDEQISHWVFALRAVEAREAIPILMKVIQNRPLDREQTEDALSAIASLGGPTEIGQLLKMALNAETGISATRQVEILRSLVATSRQRKIRPRGDLSEVETLIKSPDPRLRAIGMEASGLWKLSSHLPVVEQMAKDLSQSASVRSAAIEALAAYGTPRAMTAVEAMAAKGRPTEDRVAAVNAVTRVSPDRGAKLAVELFQEIPEGLVVQDVIRELNSRKNGGKLLITALGDTRLDADVAKLLVRAVRSSGRPSEELITKIRKAGGLQAGGWKLDDALMNTLLASVEKEGQAAVGERIYRRKDLQCMKCHAIAGAGGKVGPDLISIGGSAPLDYLIESLLVPTKKVKENFHSLQVLTDEGKVVSGIPIRKTKTELVLRNSEDVTITIPVATIEESKQGRSLMPDGTVDTLTRVELVHLLRFLSELGKVGKFAVGKEQVVRRWQSLVWTPQANQRLNRTSFDTAAGDDPELQWESRYSTVEGSLPLGQLPRFQPHREVNPTSFVRAELLVTTAGLVRLSCPDTTGLAMWVDGRPVELLANMSRRFSRGSHMLTIAIDQRQRRSAVRLELLPAKEEGAQAQWRTGK
jgi:putative heme-binding domain-containing protein